MTALLSVVMTMALTACGGGGGNSPPTPQPGPPPTPQPGPPPTPQPGSLQFTNSGAASVDEQAGTVQLTITRTGGSDGAVSVTLATLVPGGATAGQDFTELVTTVSFAAGDAAAKTVTVSITDDALTEADETFFVALLEPTVTGGAQLGPFRVAIVTIRDNDPAPAAPSAPSLSIGFEVKQLSFLWLGAARATSYKLMRRDSASPEFVQVGADLPATATTTKLVIPVHRYNWTADVPQYRIDACNASCAPSNIVDAPRVASVAATGYVKASDTTAESRFGTSVAVSGDGRTVAIGAPNVQGGVGSVYVYMAATAGDRVISARPVKISPPSAQIMLFGSAVALSEDGNTLAVGAPLDSHLPPDGVGTYPEMPNADARRSGGVFIYTRVGGTWSATPVYLKASDVEAEDQFGFSLALRGGVLVIGAPYQDSPTEDGGDVTNAAVDSGAVYTFSARTGPWVQSARILKASNIGSFDYFGSSVAISGDASVLLVGAPREDGNGTGAEADSGAAYRFVEAGEVSIPENPPQWGVAQRFKAINPGADDFYGTSVAVGASGEVFAVGAPYEDGTSVENQNDGGLDVGAVYAYTMSAGMIDVAYVKAARRHDFAVYGNSLAISGDGMILAVGSLGEPVAEIGVDGRDDAPATATNAGAVDVLVRQPGANWSALDGLASGRHYVKAVNTEAEDVFGAAVGLNNDGNTLVVGAPEECGKGTNIDGNNNHADNSAAAAGAAYLY